MIWACARTGAASLVAAMLLSACGSTPSHAIVTTTSKVTSTTASAVPHPSTTTTTPVVSHSTAGSTTSTSAVPLPTPPPTTASKSYATDYEATDLATGHHVMLKSLAGVPVLLVSWASWCVDCAAELKGIGDYLKGHDLAPVSVVLVNVEDPGGVQASRQAQSNDALNVPMWIDEPNRFAQVFSTLGVPTAVLVGGDGKRLAVFPGSLDLGSSAVQATLRSAR